MQPKVLEAIAPALVPIALNYSTSRTRTLIVSLLTLLEPSALDVYAPLLLSMLRDDVSCVRSAAMSALRGLTEDGKRRHQAAFLAMLDNTTGDVRADVVWALDCVLSPHELAQHSRLLVALAGDRDPYVRASALRAMSSLEPADLAPHAEITVRALRSPSEHERWRALEGLKALGQGSSNTVSLEPFLAQLVSSPEPWQHESLGLRYIRTSKQHQRNPHACQAAVTVGRLVTASTASRIRNHKRRGRRWLV
jgi:HEAT repeat protein